MGRFPFLQRFTPNTALDSINSTTSLECTENALNRSPSPQDISPHTYSNRATLQAAAQTVLDSLIRNEYDGNQWILILGLPKSIISSLDNDKNFLDGIHYRFQWEGTTGLIRIIPSAAHEQINADSTALVAEKLAGMGIHRRDRRWGLATTTYHHKPSAGIEIGSIGGKDKCKQGDQIGIRVKTKAGRGCEVVVQSLGRQGADCRSCSFEEA